MKQQRDTEDSENEFNVDIAENISAYSFSSDPALFH
jgi:hypothetical protein